MRILALAFCLFACDPAFSADGERPKSFTISETIQEVLEKGRDKPVSSDETEALGLSGELPSKALRLRESESPDGQEHFFKVLYKPDEAGVTQPTNLIWLVKKRRMEGEEKYFDATAFLVALNGKLLGAASWSGKSHEASATKLSITSPKVKKAFAAERKFCLTDGMFSRYDTR